MNVPQPAATVSGPSALEQASDAVPSLAMIGEDQSGPSQEAQERQAEMPLPHNLQSLLLMGIFALLAFFALYFTAEVVLPIIFAIILYLVLQPAMRGAAKLRVPKVVAALLIILVFFGGVGALGFTLSGPAADWISKAPDSLRRIEARLFVFKQPIADLQSVGKQVEKIAEGATTPDSKSVTVTGRGVGSFLFSGTRFMLVGLGTTVVLLFFLLTSGDMFLRRLVEILPTFSNKKQAVEISREIESNISSYLATISLMNLGVGVLTGIAAYFCGLSDPILWGTVAFLLNFVPILGPLCGVAILFLAGLLTFDPLWQAALPAGIYLAVHTVEETLTPILLARRFILNPVLIIVSLVFWYWMWGIAGALLAVPLLATVKIICDRIKPLMALGHFLGAEARV